MKTKLRTTYLVTVLFFLFVTVGSMILFYNMFSEEFIIANNKKIMNSVFEDAQGMDLSSLTKSDRKRLKEFSDKGGVIAIYDGEKIIYFSGDTPERKKNIKRRKWQCGGGNSPEFFGENASADCCYNGEKQSLFCRKIKRYNLINAE